MLLQRVVFDGVQRWGVVAEYSNEPEAIIANELMTPAAGFSKFGSSMSPVSLMVAVRVVAWVGGGLMRMGMGVHVSSESHCTGMV